MNTGAVYCGDLPNAVFLKGDNSYDNLDIDCDGANRSAGDCANDPTGQGQTSFKHIVQSYGIEDLDANLHTYVVFGNEGENPSFRPQDHGIEPLSVMAVVCNGQVVSYPSSIINFLFGRHNRLTQMQHYGVWGDTNGGTSTGETSLALGKLCFPNEGLNGNKGHGETDVLYIGFAGGQAVPGRNGARWTASSAQEFEDSIRSLGDRLVAGLPA